MEEFSEDSRSLFMRNHGVFNQMLVDTENPASFYDLIDESAKMSKCLAVALAVIHQATITAFIVTARPTDTNPEEAQEGNVKSITIVPSNQTDPARHFYVKNTVYPEFDFGFEDCEPLLDQGMLSNCNNPLDSPLQISLELKIRVETELETERARAKTQSRNSRLELQQNIKAANKVKVEVHAADMAKEKAAMNTRRRERDEAIQAGKQSHRAAKNKRQSDAKKVKAIEIARLACLAKENSRVVLVIDEKANVDTASVNKDQHADCECFDKCSVAEKKIQVLDCISPVCFFSFNSQVSAKSSSLDTVPRVVADARMAPAKNAYKEAVSVTASEKAFEISVIVDVVDLPDFDSTVSSDKLLMVGGKNKEPKIRAKKIRKPKKKTKKSREIIPDIPVSFFSFNTQTCLEAIVLVAASPADADFTVFKYIPHTKPDQVYPKPPNPYIAQKPQFLVQGLESPQVLDANTSNDTALQVSITLLPVLENVVAEGLCRLFHYIGYNTCILVKRQATGQTINTVLRIVYGTMKYLPYIEKSLVTQFLVYNPQFLGSLFPVKVAMLELEVNFDRIFVIKYEKENGKRDNEDPIKSELMKDGETQVLHGVIQEHKVKLSADSAEQQVYEHMENVLAEDSRTNESRAGKTTLYLSS
jgi:hypothetical protein